MSIYLITPDPSNSQVQSIESKLQLIVPEVRKITKVDDIAGEIRDLSERKIIVIYVAPSVDAGGIEHIANISRLYHERVFFILVSNEISATNYKQLIHSGGADWVAAGGELDEIREIINKQSVSNYGNAAVATKTKISPIVVSFLPCLGGVGNTTVALEVALQIKRAKATRSWKAGYVDLDFQTSNVCDFLDIEPRLQIGEIFDRPERLDEQLFELFISHHSSGLDVFAAPRSKLDPCEINIAALDALLEMISRKYEFIVIDLPVMWFSWTLPTIENSTAVVLSGVNTVPCLRQMRATLDAVRGANTSSVQVAIVINRAVRGIFGAVKRHQHVDSVLTKEKIFYIQEDRYSTNRLNTGTPATLGGPSSHVKDFTNLAAFCAKLPKAVSQQAVT